MDLLSAQLDATGRTMGTKEREARLGSLGNPRDSMGSHGGANPWIPQGDAVEGLKEAIGICDV